MKRFVRREQAIEAIKIVDATSVRKAARWIERVDPTASSGNSPTQGYILLDTEYGDVKVETGMWLCLTEDGSFFEMKNGAFHKTYKES